MNNALQWSIASIITICLCILSYGFADIPVALWFHALEKNWLYALFTKITLFGDSTAYLVGGIFLFAVFKNKKTYMAYSGLFLFSTVALSGLTADLIKFVAGRARPKLYFSEHLYGFDFFHIEHAWTSFPSGHSATALSVALFLATLYPRWRFAALFFGILVAFSRIFLAQHYISDVIAGSFFGIASSVLLYNHSFKKKLDVSEPNKI